MRDVLHRQIWQRLPRDARRTALFSAARALSPRPGLYPANYGRRIYVAGVLGSATGLGASARYCFRSLTEAGLAPIPLDLTTMLRQKSELPIPSGECRERGPGTVILHINAPLIPLAMLALGRRFLSGKKLVGYWHWELPVLPADWDFGLSLVHEVWAPSQFVCDAIKSRARCPVHLLPHPTFFDEPAQDAVPAGNHSAKPFTVLTVFDLSSSFARKNPCASIKAFRAAFGSSAQARMIVKMTNPEAFPEGMAQIRQAIGDAPNIELIACVLEEAEILTLIADCDVLISLHRAEGFGLPLAQAMALGRVVVTTGWSSAAELVTAETGCLIPFKLVPVADPQYTYEVPGASWAEADVGAAADALRRLAEDAPLRASIAQKARARIAQSFSTESYARQVKALLEILN